MEPHHSFGIDEPMNALLDASITDGWILWTLTALAIVAVIWLVVSRSWMASLVTAAISLAVALGSTLLIRWYVNSIWKPFADPIPDQVYVWISVAIFGLVAAIRRLTIGTGVTVRVLSVLTAAVVALAVAAHVNSHFGEYPTLRVALDLRDYPTVDLADIAHTSTVPLDQWRKPSDLPTGGSVGEAEIPGATSHFDARPAKVYLPPAYFAQPRPILPVLVLLAGQPGAPVDWLTGGQLVQTMDAYAASHNGLTPVVIMADATGSELANPLCMDSALGNVATYLTTDVAAWAARALQVDSDRTRWAVGGLSYGGTCALQLTTNFPLMYPTFIDMSGQIEPTLGSRQETVAAAFHGDSARFAAVNPADILRRERFPGVAGAFVVGADDHEYRTGLESIFSLAKSAGMDVRFSTVPGGHSFTVWSRGLRAQLPWLGARLGLDRQG
ncbi:alpha/beta hydrolase [Gordonia desulfuricans]|nr:alpha/beta hydrolase-fold protein [Gordonia desulfuricans]